ncbi:hypothetical protein BS78_01G022900 [Paspalum vaginatum]|nr:hypothetical protein BS78_01G022900 [Paspalum vaginatum]KAJ1292866.1 hypothetical protein BS78_01G022900 [Paspalum vaginatum]
MKVKQWWFLDVEVLIGLGPVLTVDPTLIESLICSGELLPTPSRHPRPARKASERARTDGGRVTRRRRRGRCRRRGSQELRPRRHGARRAHTTSSAASAPASPGSVPPRAPGRSSSSPSPHPPPSASSPQLTTTVARSSAAADDARTLLHCAGGLRRLLYLGSLRRDSDDGRAGYAAQFARSFRVLACSTGGPSRSKPWNR